MQETDVASGPHSTGQIDRRQETVTGSQRMAIMSKCRLATEGRETEEMTQRRHHRPGGIGALAVQ